MGSAQLDFFLSQPRNHLPPCGVQAPGEPGTSSVLLKSVCLSTQDRMEAEEKGEEAVASFNTQGLDALLGALHILLPMTLFLRPVSGQL